MESDSTSHLLDPMSQRAIWHLTNSGWFSGEVVIAVEPDPANSKGQKLARIFHLHRLVDYKAGLAMKTKYNRKTYNDKRACDSRQT